ncbi:MAG TPA: response regulator transcription factor [Verrucomicrobiae bacterium]|nr:response regulator transcription factor [Verrucomicrobiae bacterium]
MKILVVDDEITTRITVSKMLEMDGHDITMTGDPEEAWSMMELPTAPGLVILDWMMPGLTGLEFCKRLRAQQHEMRTYVLLISTRTSNKDVVEAIDAGADDFICKPIQQNELRARVRAAIRILDYERQLHEARAQLESVLRRHQLLTDKLCTGPDGLKDVPMSEGHSSTPFTGEFGTLSPVVSFGALARKALEDFGFMGLEPVTDGQGDQNGADCVIWTPLVLRRFTSWLDLAIALDRKSANALYESIAGSPPAAEQDLNDLLGESMNILQGCFKGALPVDPGDIIAPAIPRVVPGAACAGMSSEGEAARFAYRLGDAVIHVHLIRHERPVEMSKVGDMAAGDVLANAVTFPGNPDLVLFKLGTVLNAAYQRKLAQVYEYNEDKARFAVVRPSPLSRRLLTA